MLAWLDAAHVEERCDQSNGAVTAHAQVSHIIEENHAGSASRIHRLTQQSADDDVGTAGFIHNRAAEVIVLSTESFQPGAERAASQIRAAADHQASGLSSGMGIDHPNFAETTAGHE